MFSVLEQLIQYFAKHIVTKKRLPFIKQQASRSTDA